MASKPVDVLAIGNPIVDVFCQCDDQFLADHAVEKNIMTLLDAAGFERLYAAVRQIGKLNMISGGSAANTAVGVAAFGGTSGFVGRVFDDALGATYIADIVAAGVRFSQAPARTGSSTASSLILVTPDAARSMNTFLGAGVEFDPRDLSDADAQAAKIIFLEGYLFDAPNGPAIFAEAARLAGDHGAKLALSLSDPWCVNRHREALSSFVESHVSILFGNEQEIIALCECDCDAAIAQLGGRLEELIVTRGPHGAVVRAGDTRHTVPAMPQGPVIDTTGAGDLFAAGYLYGRTNGHDFLQSARLASIAAGEVITHIGARPKTDLKQLAAHLLDG
jgi:sugar/nucleoside kinase (ribokinase family)